MSTAEELRKLRQLFEDGTITEEQYDRARAKLLAEREAGEDKQDDEEAERRPRRRRDRYDDDEPPPRSRRSRRQEARQWCMFLHLSLFAGHVVPFGGIIAPIVIWQIKKEEFPEIDEHGKNAVNWIISNFIYILVCIPLCFVLVGIPLLIALAVVNVVFPIMAALKANEGRLWDNPMAIRFLK